jgi:hypothetical protein
MRHGVGGPEIKEARIKRRSIVFIDESGLSELPHPAATGYQTGKWQCCNITSTGTCCRGGCVLEFYFRLFPYAVRRPQITKLLAYQLRHIPGKLHIIRGG